MITNVSKDRWLSQQPEYQGLVNEIISAVTERVLQYKRMGWSEHQIKAIVLGEFGYIEKASDPNVGASSNTTEKEQVQ